jgi:hypothetical protein
MSERRAYALLSVASVFSAILGVIAIINADGSAVVTALGAIGVTVSSTSCGRCLARLFTPAN